MWAAQRISASLATSDGWMAIGPAPSQLVWPFRVTPSPVLVSASSTTEATSAGQAKLITLQSYFCEEYAYFVSRLKALGLFDSTVAILATQNGNSTESGFSKETHDRHNAMFMLTGRGGGYFNSLGKVVDCNDRSHNDLYVHMANAFGLKVQTIGTAAWNQGPLPGVI